MGYVLRELLYKRVSRSWFHIIKYKGRNLTCLCFCFPFVDAALFRNYVHVATQ
jgi:hypothetical protein